MTGNPSKRAQGPKVFVYFPTVSALSRRSVPIGQRITIHGTNLGEIGKVEFEPGKVATIVSRSQTSIVVAVPKGARSGVILLLSPALNFQTPKVTIVK